MTSEIDPTRPRPVKEELLDPNWRPSSPQTAPVAPGVASRVVVRNTTPTTANSRSFTINPDTWNYKKNRPYTPEELRQREWKRQRKNEDKAWKQAEKEWVANAPARAEAERKDRRTNAIIVGVIALVLLWAFNNSRNETPLPRQNNVTSERDLDCDDIGREVYVGSNDPNRLDGDGDGRGCEGR